MRNYAKFYVELVLRKFSSWLKQRVTVTSAFLLYWLQLYLLSALNRVILRKDVKNQEEINVISFVGIRTEDSLLAFYNLQYYFFSYY